MQSPNLRQFSFHDPSKDRLAKRIGVAVRNHDYRKMETRWRRISMAMASCYSLYVIANVNSALFKSFAVLGLFLGIYGLAAPSFGRLAPMKDSSTGDDWVSRV